MRISTVERKIVQHLYAGPVRTADLVGQISLECSVSVQGVYKAVRKLRAEEVITVYGKTVALSSVWIAREQATLAFAEQAYRSAPLVRELLHAPTGLFSCIFKTLYETDLFWTNAYTQLSDHVDVTLPSYAIQPHDWYPYTRAETDSYWIHKHKEQGRLSRVILTHSAKLDTCVVQHRKKSLGPLFEFMLGVNPLKQKQTTYHNLLGPYLFTVTLDRKVSTSLEQFVASHDRLPLTPTAKQEVSTLLHTQGRFTFKIEKSQKKATRLEDRIKKYFI